MSEFEKSVISHLRLHGVGDAHLSDLASKAASINSAGLSGINVQTRGTPVPDWVKISGIGDRHAVEGLIARILTGQIHGVGGIHVFPYGIPKPNVFNIEVTLGNSHA